MHAFLGIQTLAVAADHSVTKLSQLMLVMVILIFVRIHLKVYRPPETNQPSVKFGFFYKEYWLKVQSVPEICFRTVGMYVLRTLIHTLQLRCNHLHFC